MPQKQEARTAINALIIKDNKVLLLKRQNTGYCDGLYGVPAGHIDDLELGTAAMIRELKEEINLDITVDNLEQICTFHKINPPRVYVHYIFKVTNFNESQIKNMEPHKCSELKWFDMDSLPENIVIYIRNAIDAYKSGVHYLEDDFSYLEE